MAEEHQIEISPVIKAADAVQSAKRLQTVIKDALDATAGRELNSQLINIKGNIEKITTKTEATIRAIEKEKAEQERLGDLYDDQYVKVNKIREERNKEEKILKDLRAKQAETPENTYSYKLQQEQIDMHQKLFDQKDKEWQKELKVRDQIDAQQVKSEQNLLALASQQEQLNNQMRIYGEKWNYVLDRQAESGEKAELAQGRREIADLNRGIMGVTSSVRGLGMLIPGVSTKGFRAVSMITRAVIRLTSLTKDQLTAAIGKAKEAALKGLQAIASHPLAALIIAAIAVITALVKKLVDQVKKDVETIVEVTKKGLQSGLRFFSKFLVTLGKGYAALGVLVSKTILGAIVKLISKLKSFQSTITDNLKLMAKWNDGSNAVNVALSNLTSSLNYLKAALTSAFVPILTTVEPLLTSLIDKLAEVISYIGMFIAKLTGATTFQKAIRQQTDYAKALDKTGKSAKQALGPLDNLNVLTTQQGAAADAMDWEEITLADFELPDWLNDLYELGTTVGLKIRDFLNGIPWDSVKDGAKNAAQGIADFVNGMLSVRDLGTAVGHSIGEVLNTFTTFVNTLLTEGHFDKLGEQVGQAIAEAVLTVDWGAFGDIFSNAINRLADFLGGVARENDGAELGLGLSEMIAHALGNINWDTIHAALRDWIIDIAEMLNNLLTPETFSSLGSTIAHALNEAFYSIGLFNNRTEMHKIGGNVATGVNTMFSEFDAKAAGKAVSELAEGLLDLILNAVNNIEWDQVADKIVEFLSNIDWESLGDKAQDISEKLSDGLEQIWQALKDSGTLDRIIDFIVDVLNEKKNWEKAFKRLKRELFWRVFAERIVRIPANIAKGFEDLGKDIVKGIIQGMLLPIVPTSLVVLFDNIWNAICELFDINSPAKTMEPIGENIVLGILEGFSLVDFLKKVKEWWDNNVSPWFDSIMENLDILKEAIGLKVDAIKDNMIETFRAMKTGIKNPINGIIGFVESMVNKIIVAWNELVDLLNKLPSYTFTNPLNGAETTLGFNLPKINAAIELPRLAAGAIIPPNREFMAILGDQKQGTNIEAPLDTIKEAVAEVLAQMGNGSNQEIVLNLDGREFMRAMIKQNNEYKKSHGGVSAMA